MTYLLDGTRAEVVYMPALQRTLAIQEDLLAWLGIFRVLRRCRPAIVHTHMAKAGTLGRLAAIAHNATTRRSRRAHLIHTYHGHVFDGYFSRRTTRVFVAVERMLARFTDTIVAISPHVREELLQLRIGHPRQYQVVPLGFDLRPFSQLTEADRERARHLLGLAPGAPVVTTVGRLTSIKQPELFVATARLVAAQHPSAMFLMVGDGELRHDVEALIERHALGGRIRLLGWRQDLPVVYGASDVVVLTSRNEGTPVALIEALAAGVVVVSTDVGGVRDVVDDGRTGYRVPPGDAAALAAAISSLIDAPALRRSMGALGRTVIAERYGLDRLVSDVVRLYRGLMSDR